MASSWNAYQLSETLLRQATSTMSNFHQTECSSIPTTIHRYRQSGNLRAVAVPNIWETDYWGKYRIPVRFFFQKDTKKKKRGFIDECKFSVTSRVRARESHERVCSGSRKWVPKIHESINSLSPVIANAFFYNAFQTFYGVLELFWE